MGTERHTGKTVINVNLTRAANVGYNKYQLKISSYWNEPTAVRWVDKLRNEAVGEITVVQGKVI
jgi:hypothetical protein